MAAKLSDHTNRDKWRALTSANSIKVGNTVIEKNQNPDYKAGNILVNSSNNLTQQVSKIQDATSWPFRSSNGSTLTSKIQDAKFGRYQISSLMQPVTDTATGAINGTMSVVGNATGGLVQGAVKGVANPIAKTSKIISNYVAPTTETLKKLQDIGSGFDDIIKDTFLGQIFKIKGTEIICSLFCIVISMLSCKNRDALYKAVEDTKRAIAVGNSVSAGASLQIAAGKTEMPLFNNQTIADNVKGLFNKDPIIQAKVSTYVPQGTETKKFYSTIEVPPDIEKVVTKITQVLTIMAHGKITVPVGINGNIWDIAQTILYLVQCQAVQMADEFMTKVVKDVEGFLKGMMPQICIGNIASLFINKITKALKDLKDYLLAELKNLFGASEGFGVKYNTFTLYFKEIQDLLAMLKALTLVLKYFPDLALQCGVQPCSAPLPGSELEEIQNAVRNGMDVPETNKAAGVFPIDQTPKGETLEEVTNTFKKITGDQNLYVIPSSSSTSSSTSSSNGSNDGFSVVLPQIYKDTPTQIRDLILSPDFLNELGSAYTVYVPNDVSYVNVVYTYKPVC